MKCINCQTDNNLRDRFANNGLCSQCGHEFVFEPRSPDNKYQITDGLFVKLLTNISAEGTISYTDKQFHYQLDRKVKRNNEQTADNGPIFHTIVIIFAVILISISTEKNFKRKYIKSAK